ncbi:hypothetical protein CJJ09_005372 [Candidozyma auris]|nr:hypothetical protein CJJ09_005372 [[Candida] auris]
MPPKGTKGSSRAEGSGNGDSFYNSLVQGDVDVPDDKVIDEIFAERTTQHADDAIDYEDIDELADENEDEVSGMVIEDTKEASMPAEGSDDEQELQNKANDQFDAFFGDDDDQEKAAHSDHFDHMDGADMDMLGDMNNQFGFEDDGLNDLNLGFEDELGHEHTMKGKGIVQITQADLDLIEDLERNGDTSVKVKVLPFISSDSIEYDKFAEFSKDLVLASTDWDDDAIIDAGDKDKMAKPSRPGISTDKFVDDDIDYDDENIFNGQVAPDKFELNMNDPNLLFVPDKKKTDTAKSRAVIPTDKKQLQLKFNVSNDKQYEILRNNYNTKVRSQLSNLTIEHSVPALRLQTPYYKIRLSKEEARAYHRAKFQVRQGSLICFSKPKVRKKKKDKGKTQTEIFSKTSDLTAADTAPLIAMEYCEEYPNILSNFGMSSKVINYYRKEKEDDNSRPKAPIGETHVLGVEDRSPFWNFGHVAKGDFVPTLYNNMIRAPIFKQEPKSTDFLLIRSSGCGNHQRHYLRAINNLFAVGNVFPAVEVPAPHSRKVTNTSKNRLKMIVYRTMNKNGNARLSVKDISSHFPDQNDMQNRQRLKEFMEYQRKGDDQGFGKSKTWMLYQQKRR